MAAMLLLESTLAGHQLVFLQITAICNKNCSDALNCFPYASESNVRGSSKKIAVVQVKVSKVKL